MNPSDLASILYAVRKNIVRHHVPWIDGPSAKRIALAKDRGVDQDLFTVSPALYETVCELYDKLEDCLSALLELITACTDHGIKGGR